MTDSNNQNKDNKLHINVRQIVWEHDLAELMDIEERSHKIPWKRDDFLNCEADPHRKGYVAEVGNNIVGYIIYETSTVRESASDKTILNIAVDEEYRHKGVGTKLIEKVVRKLSPEKNNVVIADVSERNLPAQLFLRDCGLKKTQTIPNHHEEYFDTNSDSYVMRFKPLSAEQKIIQSLERLESITGVQWEIARRQGFAEYETCDLQHTCDLLRADEHNKNELVLRTRAMIKNPKNACNKIDKLWNTLSYIVDDTLADKADQVFVTMGSISQVYMNRGKEGQLAGDFAIAHDVRPESIVERQKLRRQETGGHDGGMNGR